MIAAEVQHELVQTLEKALSLATDLSDRIEDEADVGVSHSDITRTRSLIWEAVQKVKMTKDTIEEDSDG